MSIVRNPNLSPEGKEVEDRAIAIVKKDMQGLVIEYQKRFGIHVGTDLARELFNDYASSLENKLKYATAVQRSAAAVADAVFETILKDSQGGLALFTAGGTGAGKTVSVLNADRTVYSSAAVIFDGNFNSFDSSKNKVEQALSSKCSVIVIFVLRHPVEAYLQGVLPRALEEGRTVPIESHLRTHKDSRKTFLKAHKSFVNNANVEFRVLSNTGHLVETFPVGIDYLRQVKYDQEALAVAIKEGLDYALNEKRITQALYEASCGSPRL